MGKTYRSWQKCTPRWADERHSEQRKRNLVERKGRSRFEPGKDYGR